MLTSDEIIPATIWKTLLRLVVDQIPGSAGGANIENDLVSLTNTIGQNASNDPNGAIV